MENKVITIANHKGGVSKTTTAINLGAGLMKRGYKVLFIDLDAQANLTFALQADTNKPGTFDLLTDRAPVWSCTQQTKSGYSCIAANDNLFDLATSLHLTTLKKKIEPAIGDFDFVIIDTPPAFSALTISALTAADCVIIAMTAGSYSLYALDSILESIKETQKRYNPSLKISGVLLTKYNDRTIFNRQIALVIKQKAENNGTKVFNSTIRQAIAIEESQTMQESIFAYAPKAPVTADYSAFIDEFLKG